MIVRTRSVQKLPSCSVFCRANPRITAMATAIPTAALRKFCTANPLACTKYPIADSPEYDCQFVLVTNEIAVLNAWSEEMAGKSFEKGSHC